MTKEIIKTEQFANNRERLQQMDKFITEECRGLDIELEYHSEFVRVIAHKNSELDINLTEKETAALKAIIGIGLDCMGGRNPIDLLDDNMTWFDGPELQAATGYSKHQCAGLMSALQEKNLVLDSGEGINGQGPNQWVATDQGIKLAQRLA